MHTPHERRARKRATQKRYHRINPALAQLNSVGIYPCSCGDMHTLTYAELRSLSMRSDAVGCPYEGEGEPRNW